MATALDNQAGAGGWISRPAGISRSGVGNISGSQCSRSKLSTWTVTVGWWSRAARGGPGLGRCSSDRRADQAGCAIAAFSRWYPPAADREQTKVIREWAREHGYEVAERGRIPTNVIAAYQEAQAEASKPKAKRRRKAAASVAG